MTGFFRSLIKGKPEKGGPADGIPRDMRPDFGPDTKPSSEAFARSNAFIRNISPAAGDDEKLLAAIRANASSVDDEMLNVFGMSSINNRHIKGNLPDARGNEMVIQAVLGVRLEQRLEAGPISDELFLLFNASGPDDVDTVVTLWPELLRTAAGPAILRRAAWENQQGRAAQAAQLERVVGYLKAVAAAHPLEHAVQRVAEALTIDDAGKVAKEETTLHQPGISGAFMAAALASGLRNEYVQAKWYGQLAYWMDEWQRSSFSGLRAS